MAVARPYHEQVDIRNTKKLRELEATLPDFLFYFFRGIEPNTSSRTRIAYAYDLRVFFDYLLEYHPEFRGKDIKSIKDEMCLLTYAVLACLKGLKEQLPFKW